MKAKKEKEKKDKEKKESPKAESEGNQKPKKSTIRPTLPRTITSLKQRPLRVPGRPKLNQYIAEGNDILGI